jgi:hypothetical protein
MKSNQSKPGVPAHSAPGLPPQLERALSGLVSENVQVHYNSPEPKSLLAHAYTQGTGIHLAAGQESHVTQEAWHVVEQARGRIIPTSSLHAVQMNEDGALEREADALGRAAAKAT